MEAGDVDDYEEMSDVDPQLFGGSRRGRALPFKVYPEVLGRRMHRVFPRI